MEISKKNVDLYYFFAVYCSMTKGEKDMKFIV